MKRRAVIVPVMLVVLLVVTGLFIVHTRSSQDKARWFVNRFHALIEDNMLPPRVDEISKNNLDSDSALSRLFRHSSLVSVTSMQGGKGCRFSFRWSHAAEKSQWIDYVPVDAYDIDGFLAADAWTIKEHTDKVIRMEGGGANHKGYVQIVQIMPRFYFVEICYPT